MPLSSFPVSDLLSGLGMEESAMSFREMAAVAEAEGGAAAVVARPRGGGRPSTVAPDASPISEGVGGGPALSGAEVLRRVRGAGYRGGKSALYQHVRRLRTPLAGTH